MSTWKNVSITALNILGDFCTLSVGHLCVTCRGGDMAGIKKGIWKAPCWERLLFGGKCLNLEGYCTFFLFIKT